MLPFWYGSVITAKISDTQPKIARQKTECKGGGLGIPTDRDQRSWVFLNNPKNTLPLKENPKYYFPKSETLKIPS